MFFWASLLSAIRSVSRTFLTKSYLPTYNIRVFACLAKSTLLCVHFFNPAYRLVLS